jgi:hypothetical protein
VETAIRWLGEKRLALLIDLSGRTPIRLERHLRLVTECVTALDLPYALTAEAARRWRRGSRMWCGQVAPVDPLAPDPAGLTGGSDATGRSRALG